MSHISLPEKYNFTPAAAHSGTVVVEPFFPGYATTIGNAFRRVLLSSLPGAAISAFAVKGVPHEFSTLHGVKEDFVDISLNLKQVAVKVADYVLPEGMHLSLAVKGKRTVTAGDFAPAGGIEIMNPAQVIATLTDDQVSLEMDVFLSRGYRSIPFDTPGTEKTIGRISIDSWYSPVRDVAVAVENIRVGQMTNFERLKVTIQTNGTLTPEEAFHFAVTILLEQYRAIEQLSLGGSLAAPLAEESATDTTSHEERLIDPSEESPVLSEAADESTILASSESDEEKPKAKKRKTKKEV